MIALFIIYTYKAKLLDHYITTPLSQVRLYR